VNRLLPHYLRAEGVGLSSEGMRRCLFSLDYEEDEFEQVTAKLIDAAAKMKADGWWHDSLTHPALRRKVVAENARALCAALVSRLFGRGPPPPRFVPSAALRRA